MLSLGASELAAVAAVKSSSEIKRQLCRDPARVEDKNVEGHTYFKGVPQSSRASDSCAALICFCQYLRVRAHGSVCVFGLFTFCLWIVKVLLIDHSAVSF